MAKFEKVKWLPFDGVGEQGDATTVLHPNEDRNILLEFNNDDIRMEDHYVFIRKGCRALRVEGLPPCGCKISG